MNGALKYIVDDKNYPKNKQVLPYALKMPNRYSPKESNEWLRAKMVKLEIKSLDELSSITKIDRGSLSRYFNQERRPSIDAIDPLCSALQITSDELLIVLGAKSRN
jgi:transcriptional regulator with XRE-family HTH domain